MIVLFVIITVCFFWALRSVIVSAVREATDHNAPQDRRGLEDQDRNLAALIEWQNRELDADES